MKIVKIIFGVILLVMLVGFGAFLYWVDYAQLSFPILSSLYWLLAIIWVGSIVYFKWNSTVSLVFAILLYIIGAILMIVGLESSAEGFLRLSIIGWMVGITQALLEYKKEQG
jgi:hypothetical protein